MNGKTSQWILVALAVLSVMGGAVAYAYSNFETKEAAIFKYSTIDKKLDRILDKLNE